LVATGLGNASGQKARPTLAVSNEWANAVGRTGTHDEPIVFGGAEENVPAVMQSNRRAQADVMRSNGYDESDIPAFLRKQAD
jgi:hypothetical protein